MGNNQAKLSREEIHAIAQFSEKDIKKLYARFKALDIDSNGQLDPGEILGVSQIADNPLVQRVISIFDVDENGTVSFVEFLLGLARLAAGSDSDEAKLQKVRFAFEIYDVNKDGYISNGDLFQVMKMMVGENLSDVQLQQLVDRTMRDCDEDFDGMLSFEDFQKAVENIQVADQMSIQV